jgi:4a-hydroxytetrahydrobiopterin dehydratase
MTSCSASGNCLPCEGLDDSAKLTIDVAQAELSSMNQPCVWKITESSDGILSLHRKFVAKSFQAALDSINAIGAIAEREGHHPNFHLTNYREVEIEIFTHKLNGLSKNDFILAEQISNEVRIDYSPKWLRENPDASLTSNSVAEPG